MADELVPGTSTEPGMGVAVGQLLGIDQLVRLYPRDQTSLKGRLLDPLPVVACQNVRLRLKEGGRDISLPLTELRRIEWSDPAIPTATSALPCAIRWLEGSAWISNVQTLRALHDGFLLELALPEGSRAALVPYHAVREVYLAGQPLKIGAADASTSGLTPLLLDLADIVTWLQSHGPARTQGKDAGVSLEQWMGFVNEHEEAPRSFRKARQLGLPLVRLAHINVSDQVLALVPPATARRLAACLWPWNLG